MGEATADLEAGGIYMKDTLVRRKEKPVLKYVSPDFPKLPLTGWPEGGYSNIDTPHVVTSELSPEKKQPLQDLLFREIAYKDNLPTVGAMKSWVTPDSKRVALLPGLFEFYDVEGEPFFHIALKPVGITSAYWEGLKRGARTEADHDWVRQQSGRGIRRVGDPSLISLDLIRGTASYASLESDVLNTNRLRRAGARVTAPLVLYQYPVDKQMREEFPNLTETEIQGFEARAGKNPYSVLDLRIAVFGEINRRTVGEGRDMIRARKILELSKQLVTMEERFGTIKTDKDYLRFFMTTFGGEVVGKFVKNRYIVRGLGGPSGGFDSGHNTSLSAESKDHDTGLFLELLNSEGWSGLVNEYLMANLNCMMLYNAVHALPAKPEEARGDLMHRSMGGELFYAFNWAFLKQLSISDRLKFKEILGTLFRVGPNHGGASQEYAKALDVGGGRIMKSDLEFFSLPQAQNPMWEGLLKGFWREASIMDLIFLDRLPTKMSSVLSLK